MNLQVIANKLQEYFLAPCKSINISENNDRDLKFHYYYVRVL